MPMTIARLQLTIGAAATIVEELSSDGDHRLFAARAPNESSGVRPSRLVMLHPAPPLGPHPGAMLDRLASIRAINHPVLAAPLATGSCDGQTWVVEPAPAIATLADRLDAGSLLPVQDTVRLLRDGARALSALHRRGLCHGALSVGVLSLDSGGLRLYGLGRRVDGSVAADLHALGLLAQRAMRGEGADGAAARRHAAPPQLEQLLAALTADDPARRPASADAVLTALDWFPTPEQGRHRTLLDGVGRGGRPPGHRQAAMLLAVTAVLLLLAWLMVRGR